MPSRYAKQVMLLLRSKLLHRPYLPSQMLRSAAELGIKLPEKSTERTACLAHCPTVSR